MTEEKIYKNFIAWAGKTWWELPESEHLFPMIRANYTPEEAAFLTGFPQGATRLDELADLKGMPVEELESFLKELCRKGMVYQAVRRDSVRYRLNDTFFVFLRASYWPGKTDERSLKTAPAVNKYFLDNWFEQYDQVHHRGLRTLPIAQTIKDDRTIIPYEDAVKVVDDFEFLAISGSGNVGNDTSVDDFRRALRSFQVNIADVVSYYSRIPPCYSCGRHQECRIGGAYMIWREKTSTLPITPDPVRRWEDRPETVAKIRAAAEKLRGAAVVRK